MLFGPAGHAYVYRTRQHHCLNVAVQPEGVPGCVLIRAVEPIGGVDTMRRRRGRAPDQRLTDGPAKLAQAFGIDMRHYGADLCRGGGKLAIAGAERSNRRVVAGPRVGISVAKDRQLRFRLLDRIAGEL